MIAPGQPGLKTDMVRFARTHPTHSPARPTAPARPVPLADVRVPTHWASSLYHRLIGDQNRLFQRPAYGALAPSQLSRTPFGVRSYVSAGVGTSTVVFESGLGDGKEAWASVFKAVSSETRAIAYDRAGYGQSEGSDVARDGLQIVRELRALLQTENIPPPYVLVGHSLGGTIVKLFARIYPDEVAGVVLVDARHSDFVRRCRRMGVFRLLYEPPLALFMLARSAIRGELIASAQTMKQARRAGPFPAVPLIVMTRRQTASHWPGGVARAWARSQLSMAKLSALGRIKVCDDSGHHVHKDRPDLVVQAVLSVVAAARHLQENNDHPE